MYGRKTPTVVLVFASGVLFAATSGGAVPSRPGLTIRTSSATGLATFVTATDGGAIAVRLRGAQQPPEAVDFFAVHGDLFGVTEPGGQLVQGKVERDALGHTHTTFHQVHKGVPVFSGVLRIHQDGSGAIVVANGDFYPVSNKLDTLPALAVEAAEAVARAAIEAGKPTVEHSELVIVDPGWYGDPPKGAHLAYYLILTDLSVPVREAFFVDAHEGEILDQWTLLETARDRRVYDDSQEGTPLVRGEGDPATGDPEADAAYDYSGDTYDFLFRGFARDGTDGSGGPMHATVHSQSTNCPNAWGGTGGTTYCDGIVADDIVAHEFTHGLTGWTAQLIYQNQSGQLNESFSDIFGELVDLYNGDAGFPGPPGGPPFWPIHPTGPGTDIPNTLRTDECTAGVKMEVNSPGDIAGVYLAAPAVFGPALTEIGTTGDVVLADPVKACLPFNNPAEINGNIALVDRGDCPFAQKVKNAQNAGAVAVIVVNNVGGPPPTMGGADPTITISSVAIMQFDGEVIKAKLATDAVNVTLAANSAAGGVRWLASEDAWGFGGAIRDMWWPSCMGDPDNANHPFQTCGPGDNGGVHSGSGIPNHAFAMATDGKTYNGYTITGIGPIKAGAVWYRALTTYLGPASDFRDAFYALNQSAADLVGTNVIDPRDGVSTVAFTVADSAEVDKALLAAEMNTEGACGASVDVLDSNPPPMCLNRVAAYTDDFESGANGWTVFNTNPPTPYNWVQVSGDLPLGRAGTVWFAEDRRVGDCNLQDESAVHYLLSPVIALPAGMNKPTMAFTHYVSTQPDYDGGNVKISVNGGIWTTISGIEFRYNPYNAVLLGTNPLAGEPGWSSSGGGWGTSLIDLSGFISGGENVQFRFDFGKDGCNGIDGWYLDNFEIYTCPIPVTKFLQEPMPDGEDVPSNIDLSDESPGIVVADDFVSDGRPITAVRWWGSDVGVITGEPVLYASDGSGNNLGIVDPDTGLFTIIGPFVGAFGPITEIEWSLDGSVLYGTSGAGWTDIYTIDPQSGAILGVVPGSGYLLPGLEFDAGGNLLGFDAWTGNLVVVDPDTGGTWSIGPTGYDYPPIGGLAFDSTFSTLYGIVSGGLVPPDLLSVNPATGFATPIATTTLPTSASSLEFTADGRLVTAGHDGILYQIDPVTGTATAVGPLFNAARVSGLSLQPNTAETPPDGWLISFHEPLGRAQPAEAPLALYFCDREFVEITGSAIPACDGHPVWKYFVNLVDCCLIHAGEDSRSLRVPGYRDAFLEQEDFAYDIDIQAVVGGKFERDWSGECALVPTGTSAAANFWGWHSTSADDGLRNALTGVADFADPEWLYGPWADITPTCSTDSNMAFELLTVDRCFNSSPVQPDRLTLPGGPISQKIRYLSFTAGDAGKSQAIRVTFFNVPAPYTHWEGVQLWVQQPERYCENAGQKKATGLPPSYGCGASGGISPPWFFAADLDCDPYFTDWTQYGTIHVWSMGIIPTKHAPAPVDPAQYDIEVVEAGCTQIPGWETDPNSWSPVVRMTQSRWADLIKDCTTSPCGPPDNSTGIVDVTAILDKWKNLPGNVIKARADIEGAPSGDARIPNQGVDITDVTVCLGAYLGAKYPPAGYPPAGNPPTCTP